MASGKVEGLKRIELFKESGREASLDVCGNVVALNLVNTYLSQIPSIPEAYRPIGAGDDGRYDAPIMTYDNGGGNARVAVLHIDHSTGAVSAWNIHTLLNGTVTWLRKIPSS